MAKCHMKKNIMTITDSQVRIRHSLKLPFGSSSGKPSQDLLGLDIFGGSSSASTPTGGSYGSFPLPTQRADVATVSTNTSALTTPVTSKHISELSTIHKTYSNLFALLAAEALALWPPPPQVL